MSETGHENTEVNLFEKLRELRIQKGLSIEQVAEKSRIQLKFLQALENGDLLNIPEVYDKLFFRSYLKALDLEEKDFFDAFMAYRNNIRKDKTSSVITISSASRDSENTLFSHRTLFVVLPLALMIAVVILLLVNTEMVGNSSEEKVQEINIVNVIDRMEAREKARQDSLQRQQALTSELKMNINALHRTWFRIVADKSDTSEYLLNKKQGVEVKADSIFELLIGRADGLRFALNGRDLGVPDRDSVVVRYMRIDSSGIAIKLLKATVIDSVNEN